MSLNNTQIAFKQVRLAFDEACSDGPGSVCLVASNPISGYIGNIVFSTKHFGPMNTTEWFTPPKDERRKKTDAQHSDDKKRKPTVVIVRRHTGQNIMLKDIFTSIMDTIKTDSPQTHCTINNQPLPKLNPFSLNNVLAATRNIIFSSVGDTERNHLVAEKAKNQISNFIDMLHNAGIKENQLVPISCQLEAPLSYQTKVEYFSLDLSGPKDSFSVNLGGVSYGKKCFPGGATTLGITQCVTLQTASVGFGGLGKGMTASIAFDAPQTIAPEA